MQDNELTPWFPAHVKPVHIGPYEASYQRFAGVFRYWDGSYWSVPRQSPEGAHDAHLEGHRAVRQHAVQWRGLAKKPEGA